MRTVHTDVYIAFVRHFHYFPPRQFSASQWWSILSVKTTPHCSSPVLAMFTRSTLNDAMVVRIGTNWPSPPPVASWRYRSIPRIGGVPLTLVEIIYMI